MENNYKPVYIHNRYNIKNNTRRKNNSRYNNFNTHNYNSHNYNTNYNSHNYNNTNYNNTNYNNTNYNSQNYNSQNYNSDYNKQNYNSDKLCFNINNESFLNNLNKLNPLNQIIQLNHLNHINTVNPLSTQIERANIYLKEDNVYFKEDNIYFNEDSIIDKVIDNEETDINKIKITNIKKIVNDEISNHFQKHDNYNGNYNGNYRHKKHIFCVNCGEKGHVVRECHAPITSYGILAFKVNKSSEDDKYDKNETLTNILKSEFIFDKNNEYPKIKFLMIQRKDTIGYIDFIRGKYKDLSTCLNEMTKAEKYNVMTKTFDELWNNLWVCNKTNENFYRQEYTQAKNKYNKLDIHKLLKGNSDSPYRYAEFGFPKGRRNILERNLSCAEREFFEETGYDNSSYEFIKNYPMIEEQFTGSNGIVYKHVYYLVKMKDDYVKKTPNIDLDNTVQIGEVQNLGWFTHDECIALIRPYDEEKKKVLTDVYNDLQKMNGEYECSEYYVKYMNNTS